MSRLLTALLVALLLSSPLYGEEPVVDSLTMLAPPGEWLLESLPGELSEEELIAWQELRSDLLTSPIDLNRATYAELQQLPMLSDYQIHRLRAYRDQQGGEIRSLYDLKWIPGWDIATIQQVLPFVTIKPFDRTLTVEASAPLQVRLHSGIYYSSVAPSEMLGPPYKWRSGVSLKQKNGWQAGIIYRKPAGEPFFIEHSIDKPATIRYAAQIEHPLPTVEQITVGYYKVHWGEGLLIAPASWGRGYPLRSSLRHVSRIAPSWSTVRERYLRGIALSGGRGNWHYAAFYSHTDLDGKVDDSRDLILSIHPNPHYTSEESLIDRAVVSMQTIGMHVAYRRPKWSLGVQTLYADWLGRTLLYLPHYKAIHPSTPYRYHWLTSASYSWLSGSRRLEVAGEVASSQFASVATLHRVQYHLPRQQRIGATLYYTAPHYASLYGQADTHYSQLGNDSGIRIYYFAPIKEQYALLGEVEAYRSPEPRYRQSLRSHGLSTRWTLSAQHHSSWQSQWQCLLATSDREQLRSRLSATVRYHAAPLSLIAIATLQQRRLAAEPTSQYGRTVSLRSSYLVPHNMLTTQLQFAVSYYHNDHRHIAPYVYHPGVPYSFGYIARAGQGAVTALTLRLDLADSWSLQGALLYDYNPQLGSRYQVNAYVAYAL